MITIKSIYKGGTICAQYTHQNDDFWENTLFDRFEPKMVDSWSLFDG